MPQPAPPRGGAGEREPPPHGASGPLCSAGPGLVRAGSSCPSSVPASPQWQRALAQLDGEDACSEFRQQQLTVHRVHVTFLPHELPPPRPLDVTLVAQLSMDR